MKRFYLILLMTILSWQLPAQVSIGNGTGTYGSNGPIYPYYNYSYFQTIYKASDINASGNITSIRYEMTNDNAIPNTDDNIDVWVGHTSKTVFDDSYDWIDVSSLTQVLADGSLVKAGNSVTITFSTPFNYNGTDNLVIAVNAKEPGCEGASDVFYYTEAPDGEHPTICRYSDNAVIDVNNPTGQGMYSNCYPNITINGIAQACPLPSGLNAANVLATSAEIDWTENGTAFLWNVEYGEAGFTQGTGTVSQVTSKPYTLQNLMPGTNYEVYVQADCGSGEASAWVGSLSFVTACADVFTPPYTAPFNINPPTCWNEADNGTLEQGPLDLNASSWRDEIGFIDVSGNNVYSNALPLSNTDHKDWLISPTFDLSGGDYELKTVVALTEWHFSGTSSDPANMGSDDEVHILVSEDDGATWVSIKTWNAANQPAPTGTEAIIDLSAYNGNVKFAIFGTDGDVDDDGMTDFHVGHFEVRPLASCSQPSDLSATNIMATSVDLTWTENGTATAWNIEYGAAGFAQGSGTIVENISANPYTLTGLTQTTDYSFYVQARCSDSDQSYWVGPYNFTTPESCPTPTNLSADNITAHSAKLAWEANISSEWSLEYGEAGFTQGSGTTITVQENPYALNNLESNTEYDFYVQAVCSDTETSNWAGPFSFETACDVFTPDYTAILENTNPPACWMEARNGNPNQGWVTTGAAYWTSARAFTNAEGTVIHGNSVNLYDNNRKEWLVSPSFDLSGGNAVLNVLVAVTKYKYSGIYTAEDVENMGSDDEVQLLISEDDGETWTAITTWNATNQPIATGTENTFDLSSYTGTVKFAIYAMDGISNDEEDYEFHLGKFEITASSTTCFVPTNVMISDVTTNTANISWTAPTTAPANGYEYIYSQTNEVPTTDGTLTTETNVALTGLTSATQYYVWVRSVCSDTDKSAWTNVSEFTTVSETGNYTITFNVTDGTNPLENVSIIVGGQTLMTDANGVATIELPNEFYPYTATLTGYTEANGTFTVSNANQTINIVMLPLPTSYTVTFNVTDGTNPLENASILVNNQTLTTGANGVATIELPNGYYNYTVTLDGYNEESSTFSVNDNDKVLNVSMTLAETVDCTGFTAEFTDGFETYEELSSSCWTTLLEGCTTPSVDIVSPTEYGSNKMARLKQGMDKNGVLYFISPKFTDLNNNKEISAKIRREYTDSPGYDNSFVCTFEIGIMTDATDISTFQSLKDISEETQSEEFVEVSTNTNAYTGGEGYVVFKYTVPTQGNAFNNIFLDDFKYAEFTGVATCDMPTDVTATDVTTNTATISWTAPATAPANGYKIKLYNSVTHELTFTETTNTSGVLSGLTPGVTYYVYVQSICSTDSESEWTESVNFTTTQEAVACDMPTEVMVTDVTTNTATVSWTAPATAPANGYKIKLYNSVTHELTLTETMNTSEVLSGLTQGVTYYVYVRSVCGTDNQSDWTESVNFTTTQESVTCDMPTEVMVTDVTTNTATVSWTAPANTSVNGYQVKLYNSVTHEVSFTETTNTSEALSGLTPGITYYVYVRSVCGTDNQSEWTESVNFTTLQTSIEKVMADGDTRIYPNPFTNVVIISDIANVSSIEVLNAVGTVVKISKPKQELNMSNLPSGMYLINITYQDGSVKSLKAVRK